MPVSKSILPSPYFFDNSLPILISLFSKSDNSFVNCFLRFSNLIWLICSWPNCPTNWFVFTLNSFSWLSSSLVKDWGEFLIVEGEGAFLFCIAITYCFYINI